MSSAGSEGHPLSTEESALLGDAEFALSEAGSVSDLRAAAMSIEQHSRLSDQAKTLLDSRMRERAAQLRSQDRQRTINMLSAAPFHASSNTMSAALVERLPHINPIGSDSFDRCNREATAPLPFDGHAWADYLEHLAPTLATIDNAKYLRSHTETLAKTLRSVADGTAAEATRSYVAIVGRRGVGRGSVFQALTNTGAITKSESVGAKMLPVALRHDDHASEPVLFASQVARVWLPLRAAVQDAAHAPKARDLVMQFLAGSEFQKVDSKLLSTDWSRDDNKVRGNELIAFMRYAHAVLHCLARLDRADRVLHDVLWGDASPTAKRPNRLGSQEATTGPPEIRCRFPWLRGCESDIVLVDVPTPDEDDFFMHNVAGRLLQHAITTIVVDEARPRKMARRGSSATVSQVMSPPSPYESAGKDGESSSENRFGGPPKLWAVLRTYAEHREREYYERFSRPAEDLSRWDAELPPSLMVALTIQGDDMDPIDHAQLAVACHVRLRRLFGVSVNITSMFVVAPEAAGAAVRLFDSAFALVHSDSESGASGAERSPMLPLHGAQDDPPGTAGGPPREGVAADVHGLLSKLQHDGLIQAWRSCLRRGAVGNGPEPPLAKDLSELLSQNETVWRMASMGWLVSAILQHVIANHEVPQSIGRLVRAARVVDDMAHCCAEALLQPEVYKNSQHQAETRFADQIRTAIAPLTGSLKQQLASVDEQLRKWNEDRPPAPAPSDRQVDSSISGSISAAFDQATDKVQKTRHSLASVIRSKIFSSNALIGTHTSYRDRSAGNASPGIAAQAMEAVARRAASALQGTTADVGVVSETLRAWWHHLPDSQRIGDTEGESVTFRAEGEEAALRIAFGVPELAIEFAGNADVVGNPDLAAASNAVREINHNPLLKSALASKPAKAAAQMNWAKIAPPKPIANIEYSVTEHSRLNAAMPSRGKQPYLLQVSGIEHQAHRELQMNLAAAQRYIRESLAVTIAFEESLLAIACAELIQRHATLGEKEIAIPSQRGPDGSAYSPLALAFAVFELLSCLLHGALASHHHVLAASIVRPDDMVAQHQLTDDDNATLLHFVGRLREGHAEWRRWRVALHREQALTSASVVDAIYDLVTRNVPDALSPPHTVDPQEMSQVSSASQSQKRFTKVGSRALPRVVLGAPGEKATVRSPSTTQRSLPASAAGRRKKAVVCLCGGGVRGVISAMIVQRLDTLAQRMFSQAGKRRVRLWDIVDEFIGTSTGAIVAALLCIGVDPSAIVNLYKNYSTTIFPPSNINAVTNAAKPKHPAAGRLEIAHAYLGRRRMNDDTVYAGIARPKVLLCDMSTLRTRVCTDADDIAFVEALMAATAAPTFFPAVKIGSTFYCDGGIAENHPGLEVAKDLRNVAYVATVGTGIGPSNYEHLHNAGLLHWAPCFADAFIDSTQYVADEVLKAIFGDNSEMLNVTLPPGKMALDDPSTVPKCIELVEKYMKENNDLFEQVVRRLYETSHGLPSSAPRNPVAAEDEEEDAEEPQTPFA